MKERKGEGKDKKQERKRKELIVEKYGKHEQVNRQTSEYKHQRKQTGRKMLNQTATDGEKPDKEETNKQAGKKTSIRRQN